MNRRNFLGLGLGVAAVAAIPAQLSAVDFRATKPKAWEVINKFKKGTKGDLATDGRAAAIKEIFGMDVDLTKNDSKIKLKTPAIAENGAVVPVSMSTKRAVTKVAILQNANPESLVCVFTVPAGQPVDYSVRIKMQQTGDITVVVEESGKLYAASSNTKVTAGGCGG